MQMTLKALRVNAGLSQVDVAKRLKITPETLSNWERAKSFPNVPQITELEKLYGVTYSDINFLPADIGLTEDCEE